MAILLIVAMLAAVGGGIVATWWPPRRTLTSALQHFAAGLVFAAAAAEVLPGILAKGLVAPVVIGGAAGIVAMLALRALGARASGPVALIGLIGVDIAVDGLVLGLAFAAGERQGLVLGSALVAEILFLGLAVSTAFDRAAPRWHSLAATAGVALLLPLGVLLAGPARGLPAPVLDGLFSFALIALLYLVTEELLVEAHEVEDTPWSTALFFVGFLALVVLEEALQ